MLMNDMNGDKAVVVCSMNTTKDSSNIRVIRECKSSNRDCCCVYLLLVRYLSAVSQAISQNVKLDRAMHALPEAN
jgi:hypothetical protein